MVARMLHQLMCSDPQLQFEILRAARSHLELGGPARLRHTFPALAFCGLKAIRGITTRKKGKQQGSKADDPDKASADGESNATTAAGAAGAAAEGAQLGASSDITAEAALQWLLEVVLQLAEVPAPMQVRPQAQPDRPAQP